MAFLLNEDFENFAAHRPMDELSEYGIKKQLELYSSGGENILIYNGNGQKAVFDSEVFDPLWKDLDVRDDGSVFYRGKEVADSPLPFKSNALHTKILFENVKDPFGMRIKYGRKLGQKIYLSMRMNDVHWVENIDSTMVSDFWREHQDCQTASFTHPGQWWFHTFDYAKPEVYNYHLALVKEYLTRFDPDGFELDWMRTPYYFEPGWEAENAKILTQFMRDAKKLAEDCAKRNGHPVAVTVRVPSQPDDARRMGFDVPAWVKEKLIDRVVLTSYWGVTDFDIPLELWRALLGNEIKITAGMEILCKGKITDNSDFFNDAAVVFGYASSYYYRGSDDIYLFNHMDASTGMRDPEGFRKVLKNLGEKEKTFKQKRRHVVSYTDTLAKAIGIPISPVLPLTISAWNKFIRINLGAMVKNRNAKLVISCENGLPEEVRCGKIICEKTEELFADKLPGNIKNPVVYRIPDEALKEGDNVFSFVGKDNRLLWCEIDFDEA